MVAGGNPWENRIIEIEWAFKNNQDYVPSPKLSKKSKKKRRVKSYLGRENTAMDHDEGGGSNMQVDVDSRDGGRSEAVVGFGMEITNTESPVGSKRTLADTGESTAAQTPPKRQKRMKNIIVDTPVVQVSTSSDDEYGEAPGVVKKVRRLAVVI
jgi:kinesin family member 22